MVKEKLVEEETLEERAVEARTVEKRKQEIEPVSGYQPFRNHINPDPKYCEQFHVFTLSKTEGPGITSDKNLDAQNLRSPL